MMETARVGTRTVVVVGDHRRQLERELTGPWAEAGSVLHAADEQEAVRLIVQHRPDLVVVVLDHPIGTPGNPAPGWLVRLRRVAKGVPVVTRVVTPDGGVAGAAQLVEGLRRLVDHADGGPDARRDEILAQVPTGLLLVDDRDVVVSANPAAVRLLTGGDGQAVGRRLGALLERSDGRPVTSGQLQDATPTLAWPVPTDVERELELRASGTLDGCRLVHVEDVTRRNADLRDGRAAAARLRELVELGPEVYYEMDLDPHLSVTYVSDGIADLTGHRALDYYDRPGLWCEQVHEDDRARWGDLHRSGVGLATRLVVRVRAADGTLRWVEDRRLPRMVGDRLVGLEGVLRDLTPLLAMAREEPTPHLRLVPEPGHGWG